MKMRTLIVAALAMRALAPIAMADDAAATPAAPAATAPAPALLPPGADADKDTPLEIKMKVIARNFRLVKRQVAKPELNAATLQNIALIQAATADAMELSPKKTDDLPADQRAQFVSDYKSTLKDFQGLVAKLKDAIAANDNAGAKAIVDQIEAQQKKAHKEFRKPENH